MDELDESALQRKDGSISQSPAALFQFNIKWQSFSDSNQSGSQTPGSIQLAKNDFILKKGKHTDAATGMSRWLFLLFYAFRTLYQPVTAPAKLC